MACDARRILDELAVSHPEKICIAVGMFQADTFIQHLLTKRTVDIVVGNDTDFAVVAGEACGMPADQPVKERKRMLSGHSTKSHFLLDLRQQLKKCRKHLGTIGIFNDAKMV